MDLTSNSTVKTPDAETETPTPTRIPSNGVLKRHPPLHLHHPVVLTYKECLKNHAASLGGHALDGCGEFMPSPATNPADPTSLTCAACGCHRNFHRREPEEPMPPTALEYLSHRRHQPPPPPPPMISVGNSGGGTSPDNSPSPPPISSSYYPSAPHMLLALSHGGVPPPPPDGSIVTAVNSNSSSRKRFRSKFTQFQKDKMLEFAEKLGWKMQKREEDAINDFCAEIGVEKGVLKVWMHNNKTNFAKKDQLIAIANPPDAAANGYPATVTTAAAEVQLHDNSILVVGTNGSSSP